MKLEDHNVNIEYPCMWNYKIIGQDVTMLRAAVAEILPARRHSLAMSNRSHGNKYVSMTLDLKVSSEADRHSIFDALKQHPAVNMVL